MTATTALDITTSAGSVGHVLDRSLPREESLGIIWLVEANKAVACAHALVLYSDFLPALKVRFPAVGMEFGVEKVAFHPRFDQKQTVQMARKALQAPVAGLPLQENNLAVLSLSLTVPELTPELVARLNDHLGAPAPRQKGLSGSLSEIDFALVVQTINNARKQGVLVISDERHRPVARIFCQDGRIASAQYGQLHNEAAIYQIVGQNLSGHFHFQAQKEPDWAAPESINRPTDMLLIEAHRRVDEIPRLLLELGGDATVFERACERLDCERLSPEIQQDARRIWPYLSGTVAAGQLWRIVLIDDYAVFGVLRELLSTGQIKEAEHAPLSRFVLSPLALGPELPLSPWDKIDSLTVDAYAGCPLTASGHLLGSLRPGDPWHLLHDLQLPAHCAGAPLFKDGKVIGLHCGALPVNPTLSGALPNLQQAIWAEAVYTCLEGDGAAKAGSEQAQTARQGAGCIEVARIDCPKCGTSSLDSAKFCKSCGQRLIQEIRFGEPRKRAAWVLPVAVAAAVTGVAAFLWKSDLIPLPRPPAPARLASRALVTVSVDKADPARAAWVPAARADVFHTGDLIRFRIRTFSDSFLYVLYRGTTSPAAHLIYPDGPSIDQKLPTGTIVTIPRETATVAAGGHVTMQGLTVYGAPGTETVLVLASPRRARLLADPQTIEPAFDHGKSLLATFKPLAASTGSLPDSRDQASSAQGLEVPIAGFWQDLFPPVARNDKTVTHLYLTDVDITHKE